MRQKTKKAPVRQSGVKTANTRTIKTGKNRYRNDRSSYGGGFLTRFFKSLFGGVLKVCRVVFSGVFVFILIGLFSGGLIFGYHYLVNSDYFTVRKVVLSGLNRVSRDDVLTRTGLNKPANILALKLGPMAADLRSLNWVEDVTITRKLPDTIIVQVEERRPKTLISLGSLYYLDAKGRPFKKVDPKEKPELPIITGFSKSDLMDGNDFVTNDLQEIFSLLDVLAVRNDRFRIENISEINFDPVRGLSLFTRDENIQVKVGVGDYRKKFWRLGRVLANLKIKGRSEGLTYFNLECSPRVIVRRAAQS